MPRQTRLFSCNSDGRITDISPRPGTRNTNSAPLTEAFQWATQICCETALSHPSWRQ